MSRGRGDRTIRLWVPVLIIDRYRLMRSLHPSQLHKNDVQRRHQLRSRAIVHMQACHLRVTGACELYPSIPQRGWFNDTELGGPAVADWATCLGRKQSWQRDCGESSHVDVRFGARDILLNDFTTDKQRLDGPGRAAAFRSSTRGSGTAELYVTLWLQQVHSWFPSRERRAPFLNAVRDAGASTVMTDLPWAWSERFAENAIDIDNFSKDWMGEACNAGLKLFVVVRMNDAPPWLLAQRASRPELFEAYTCSNAPEKITSTPTLAHPHSRHLVHRFFKRAVAMLRARYGECLAGISPTMNNELETRYIQEFDCARDYSEAFVNTFRRETARTSRSASSHPQEPPPLVEHCCINQRARGALDANCDAPPEATTVALAEGLQPRVPRWQASSESRMLHRWLSFRERFLADQIEAFCRIVHTDGMRCLLHFGEFFASTDLHNSNPFALLAASPVVSDLIVDSNMALLGAPTSPSVVGLLVSAAKTYNKTVHFEAATERILPCATNGTVISSLRGVQGDAARALYTHGVSRALEAGADTIGITNLCEPSRLSELLGSITKAQSMPTALIIMPYQAWYHYSFVLSGGACGTRPLPCWRRDFWKLPVFGKAAEIQRSAGDCAQDPIQHSLLQIWDDLRMRHAAVAVISDAARLSPEILGAARERVLVKLAGAMSERRWHFEGGRSQLANLRQLQARFQIDEVTIGMHITPQGKEPSQVREQIN